MEKPYFPKRTEEDIYWPYLATIGYSEKDFSSLCVREVEVIAIRSLTTVRIRDGLVEYDNIPVRIHTDIGARKSFYLKQEKTPSEYFENAATMFPFPGGASISRYETPGNMEDTSVFVSVAPKVLCVFRNETPLSIIGIVSNLDNSDVYEKKISGINTPQRTYKPYVLLKLFVDKIPINFSPIRIHTDYILYDMIDEEVATINKYDNGPPNYTHEPIDEYILAKGADNYKHIKSFLTASNECFSAASEYTQTQLVEYGVPRPGGGFSPYASSCKGENGVVVEGGWIDGSGAFVDDEDHFRWVWIYPQSPRYPYTATCYSGSVEASTSVLENGLGEFLTGKTMYITKASHVLPSVGQNYDAGTIRVKWSENSYLYRTATFSESWSSENPLTYSYTERMAVTFDGEPIESIDYSFTHSDVWPVSGKILLLRYDSDIQYFATKLTNLFHSSQFCVHFFNVNNYMRNNIIIREDGDFMCKVSKAIEVLQTTMEEIVADIKSSNPLYDNNLPLQFTAKIEGFHYVPYDPRITQLEAQ